MISDPQWRSLELRHASLHKAWDELKRVRAEGKSLSRHRRAMMRYLQALQRVYEASQSAVSLHSPKDSMQE